MTEYHRGKARSPYRKRTNNVLLSHSGTGSDVDVLMVGLPTGLIESKSWRGHVQYSNPLARPTSNAARVASGFVGFYRGEDTVTQVQDLNSQDLLGRSEFFGVKPWTVAYNDTIVYLELKGITLSRGENLYIVSHCAFETNFSSAAPVRVVGQLLYAVKEIPA